MTLLEAAQNVYCAWMGGTMNDVREAMKDLGEVLDNNRSTDIDEEERQKLLETAFKATKSLTEFADKLKYATFIIKK